MIPGDGRVAISGLGVLSPIGIGQQRFWSALCDGLSGIRALPEATQIPHVGAQLVDYLARDFVSTPHLRRMDKVSRALVSAATMALADAALEHAAMAGERGGIVVGSALGNITESVQHLDKLFHKGASLVSPMVFPNLVLNAAASYAAMEVGSTGVNLTVTDGEVSAEQAVGLAVDVLRHGRADRVLAGGVDEWSDMVAHAYRCLRALAGQRGGRERCSPFAAQRNGIVLGEGAAMLLLEPLAAVRARGAAAYATIESLVSFGMPSSPYGWPRAAGGAAERLQAWLQTCGVAVSGIELVIANANGSRQLDGLLLDILAQLFGAAAPHVALTSIRGAVGEHGGAGALSIAAACLALRHQLVPPLCHLENPAPEIPFQLVAPRAAAKRIERVLHFSVARGGSAVAMLLREASS